MNRAALEAEAKNLYEARVRMVSYVRRYVRPGHYQARCEHPLEMIHLVDDYEWTRYYRCADCGVQSGVVKKELHT